MLLKCAAPPQVAAQNNRPASRGISYTAAPLPDGFDRSPPRHRRQRFFCLGRVEGRQSDRMYCRREIRLFVIKSGGIVAITTLPLGEGRISVVHYLRLTRADLPPDPDAAQLVSETSTTADGSRIEEDRTALQSCKHFRC